MPDSARVRRLTGQILLFPFWLTGKAARLTVAAVRWVSAAVADGYGSQSQRPDLIWVWLVGLTVAVVWIGWAG